MKEIVTRKDFKAILLLLVAVAFLSACSSDSDDRNRQKVSFKLQSYVREYQEVLPPSYARNRVISWPDGFDVSDMNRNIGVFFTQAAAPAPTISQFIYSGGQWYSTFEMEPTTYYLYGYIPYDRNISSSISLLGGVGKTFADGAVLTLSGMPCFTVNDVCVIVGVKKGTSSTESNGNIVQGKFDYTVNAEENHVYLLFDHLYSGLKFSIKVDGEYNKLRTIKLKEMTMTLKAKNGTDPVKEKMNVTITLAKNGLETTPIQSVTITPDGSSNDVEALSVYKTEAGEEDLTLLTTPVNLYANFAPFDVTRFKFELVSTYDVFDKDGNLVRKDCEATNTLDIGNLFAVSDLNRGTMYTVNLTVNPTYLYVLSDPDLDNPTIKIE